MIHRIEYLALCSGRELDGKGEKGASFFSVRNNFDGVRSFFLSAVFCLQSDLYSGSTCAV